MAQTPRPGHAEYTYQLKVCLRAAAAAACAQGLSPCCCCLCCCSLCVQYGTTDPLICVQYGTRASSGGGRSSARETIGRVAGGAVAEKWLFEQFGTRIVCYVNSIGSVRIPQAAEREWTREEVDELGWLQLINAAGCVDSNTEKASFGEAEQAEQVFLKAADDDVEPCYVDKKGVVYDRNGNQVQRRGQSVGSAVGNQ